MKGELTGTPRLEVIFGLLHLEHCTVLVPTSLSVRILPLEA